MANLDNLDYDTTRCLEILQDIATTTTCKAETYDLQLNLLYKWVKTDLICRRVFKNLLSLLVG